MELQAEFDAKERDKRGWGERGEKGRRWGRVGRMVRMGKGEMGMRNGDIKMEIVRMAFFFWRIFCSKS